MGILDTIQNTVSGIFKSKECDCDKPVSESAPATTSEPSSAPTVGGRRRTRRHKSRRHKSRRRKTRRRRRRRR